MVSGHLVVTRQNLLKKRLCVSFFSFFFLSTLTSRQDRSLAIMQSVSFHPELHASSNLKNLILTLFTGMKILILPRSTFHSSEFSIDFECAPCTNIFLFFLKIFYSLIFVESESRS